MSWDWTLDDVLDASEAISWRRARENEAAKRAADDSRKGAK